MSNQDLQQTYKLSIEGENTITLTFTKILSEKESSKQAEVVVSKMMDIFGKDPQKNFDLLIDLTQLETLPSFFTEESKGTYTTLSRHPQLARVAIVGANMFYKLITNFLMTATGKGTRIQWFENKSEALTWLNKD